MLNGDHSDDEIDQKVSEGVRCEECGTKYTEKHVETFVNTMEFTEEHLKNMENVSVACILFIQFKLFAANTFLQIVIIISKFVKNVTTLYLFNQGHK